MGKSIKNLEEEHKEYNREHFRNVSKHYDLLEFFLNRLRGKTAGVFGEGKGRLLDAACGTGTNSIRLAGRGWKVAGIDLSPEMLAVAKKKIRKGMDVRFLEGDASKMPFRDNDFDGSLISFSLHEMPEKLLLMTLKEMMRVTRKEGKIVVVDFIRPETMIAKAVNRVLHHHESGHYEDFLKNGVEHYVKKAGISITSEREALFGVVKILECEA